MQREIAVGGAGHWIIKNGKLYDPARGAYVLKCRNCKKAFYGRIDAETCGDACRQAKARKERSL